MKNLILYVLCLILASMIRQDIMYRNPEAVIIGIGCSLFGFIIGLNFKDGE